MANLDNSGRLHFSVKCIIVSCLVPDETLNKFQAHSFSVCDVQFPCDFSLLSYNTLMTLSSESHITQSEFNISEIRQQAGPVILAWMPLQRLME